MNREEAAKRVESATAGCRVARAKLGLGSILLVDLERAEKSSEHAVHIRVECAWRIENDDSVLAASEDNRTELADRIVGLNGSAIQEVSVRAPSFQLEILFENRRRLVVFPIYANNVDYENWTMHMSSGAVVVAGPGREVRIVSSTSS